MVDSTPPQPFKRPSTPPTRSLGQRHVARALWYVGEGKAELRHEPLPALTPGHSRVRTLYSALSRGTERLVLAGAVPPGEYERMRAPLQIGSFPYPVKYGYCAVGIVEQGAAALFGRVVFCLHPHQDMFQAPDAMLLPVPDGVPAKRATLAANMETALNAVWDSAAAPGDRIVIVGAGIVGLMVASICARLPAADVTVADVAVERRALVEAMGARFWHLGEPTAARQHNNSPPADNRDPNLISELPRDPSPVFSEPPANANPAFHANANPAFHADADIVFHTSANPAGLATAFSCAGVEAKIVEMSWYGATPVEVPLGAAFHSRRLQLISSQVGQISPGHRPRWDYRRRLTKALAMLADPIIGPVLDQFVANEIAFADAATAVPAALAISTVPTGRVSGRPTIGDPVHGHPVNGHPVNGLAPILRYGP